MLIDVNAYTGHWPFRQLKNNSCEKRFQLMQALGIDISVMSNLNGVFYKNPQSANEELFEDLKSNSSYGNRIIPFAVINPIYSGWKDDLKICIEKMGMKGVRLHPLYHRYDLKNSNCIELVKRVRDLNLPVALSLRIVDSRVSSWMDIETEWSLKDVLPIIKEVPDAKYLILNAVNSLQIPDGENESAIANIRFDESGLQLLKKTNFLMDTSGRAMTDLGKMIALYGKEKFAYGSHSPILDNVTGLLRIESLRAEEADEAAKNLLKFGNAKRFFNL
ncbi:MAG: amidohydrolase [Chitinophagales bacterium]|nr:amidohydrolase [Chitinophagales bacterium]